MATVCVIGGAGYVGLITGVGLAELGHEVVSVDVDASRLEKLREGVCPIYEQGLEPILRQNLVSGRLRFTDDLPGAVSSSEVVFISVGTPSRDDGQADLSQVIHVAEELARSLETYKVVVIKSTVPVGTVEVIRDILRRKRREGEDFDIVSSPEFLREGKGLYDFFHPDRIVVGTCSQRAREVMKALYHPLIQREGSGAGSVPLVETDLATAQMIKYASNAFLATRISFINEVAGLCERLGANVTEVARGMGFDPRIGHGYLQPGLGFGGPCLEKDLRALIRMAEETNYEPQLLRAVLDRNARQIEDAIAKLKRLTGNLHRKRVTVFGLAFKAGTNDVRNSLALKVIDRLLGEGATVRAHDPIAIPEAQALRPGVTYCEDPYEAVHHAEALLILTDWPAFAVLDYKAIRDRMANPCVVDMRNLLDPAAIRAIGMRYTGVGLP
jgi:UDPglucose 6-dehydrogenase